MSVPVSIGEVLEVRDTWLSEEECWCLLRQALPPLAALLKEAASSSVSDW